MGASALRGRRAASDLAAAQGAVAGGAGAAGAAELGASDERRPGALLGLDDRALVLPGAVGAPGSGQGLAPAGADRCRPRAEDVAAARRGFARSVRGPPVLVGAAAPFAGGLAQIAVERQAQVGKEEGGSNFTTIANQLAFLNYPELLRNTARSTFDPLVLAEGNTDLFVVAPEETVEHVKGWLRLWVTIPNAVAGRTPLERDMLIVIDEMPRIGFLKPVMDGYPADAVICWTERGRVSGGTGMTIRLARAHGIPVFNLAETEPAQAMRRLEGIAASVTAELARRKAEERTREAGKTASPHEARGGGRGRSMRL